jgi:hypothetical protein
MDGQRSWESIAGGVVATVGPLVAAGVGWGADVPGWAPATLAVAGTAAVAARNWRLRQPWSELAFKVAAGLTGAGWTAWSTVVGPWHLNNLVAGAAAAAAGLFLAPAFLSPGDAPDPQILAQRPDSKAPSSRAAIWKARIEAQARVKPIKILHEEDWPNGAGFTMRIAFAPESGDGWNQVDDAKHRLARAAHLPKGCVIGVEEGDLQGSAIVRIPTVYAMAGEASLPEDVTLTSVWDDHAIGRNEDGSEAEINLREAAGLIVSRRGGGKSNLQKVLIRQLLRCCDSLVWVVDLNGGGLAVPFMLPFADGEVDVAPIDWVASTPEEAVVMAQVAAAIVRDRKARYAGLTARSGGDLLPVTRDLPQITIVIDEGAEVENNPAARKAMESLQEVLRIGRADAVNVLFSGLRGTQDMMPVPVRKQTTLKLCGPVEDDTEMDYVLPGAKVRSADLVHPGTMFMRRSDKGPAVRQIKVFRALPDALRRGVLATAHLRPTLDAAGRQIGGQVYAERLQRLQPWLDRLAGRPVQTPAPATARHAAEPAATTADDGPAPSRTERDAARDRARQGLRRVAARAEMDQMPKDQLDEAFGALTAELRPADDSQDGDGWRPELLLDLAREAGQDGIGPTEAQRILASRGIKVSMKTINKWLPKYAAEGRLRNVGGRYAA